MDLDARLTRQQAAQCVGLTPAAIGMWKLRGHIDSGPDGLYRLGDVIEVERQMRRHPNSRRKVAA